MPTAHNNAPKGAFAKTVLMPGDPLRAKFIAETFLENPVLVNNVRGIQGYTGTYKGVVIWIIDIPLPRTSTNCFGYSGVLIGQKRLPMPPAMITI